MGRISFWSLLIYLVFRMGDMIVRGQFASAFYGRMSTLFVIELVIGGILPLFLLARRSFRMQPKVLLLGAFLVTIGVVFNRVNVVLLAMDLKGPMPQIAPSSYAPSIFEWGISIGLIAATIFLFGLCARLFPLLPVGETSELREY